MAHILVVDAETPIRALTARSLILERHDVVDVGTGAEALAAIAARVFDAIVIDADVPDMDSADLLAAMARHPGTRATPVVLLTTNDDPDEELRAAQLGVIERLVKPVGFGQLIATVRRLLAQDRGSVEELRVRRVGAADLYRSSIDLTNQARQRT